jgi:uncharacterized protein (UPF0335 family)
MAKIQSIWNEDNIRALTGILVNHANQNQATFLSAARNQLKYQLEGSKKTHYYTEKQIIAKSREIARQATKAGYDVKVPRKATKTAIIQDWGDVFQSAGLTKAKKGK